MTLTYSQSGSSLVVQWLGFGAFTAVAQVQSLVAELRSLKPLGASKNKNRKTPIIPSSGSSTSAILTFWAEYSSLLWGVVLCIIGCQHPRLR